MSSPKNRPHVSPLRATKETLHSSLQAITPSFPQPYFNPLGDDPSIVEHIFKGLHTRCTALGRAIDPDRSIPKESALRSSRIDQLAGHFIPDVPPHVFRLNVAWMILLWMIDDTMDRAQSATALSEATRINGEHVLAVSKTMTVEPHAPPLAHFILDFCLALQAASPRQDFFSHFQQTVSSWLLQGSFKLASHRISGVRPSIEQHIRYRRWDGAADSCFACMAYGYPNLPSQVLTDDDTEELRKIASTHIGLLNDLISYEQEITHSATQGHFCADSNLLETIMHEERCSFTEACDRLKTHLRALHVSYWERRATLRKRYHSLAAPARQATYSYMDHIGRFMQGNLVWSFATDRYRSTQE